MRLKKKFKILLWVLLALSILAVSGLYLYKIYFKVLPKENLTDVNNLYIYDIFEKDGSIVTTKIKDNYLYYLFNGEKNDEYTGKCKIVKFNLLENKKITSYDFDCSGAFSGSISIEKNKIIIINSADSSAYIFDDNLKLIKEIKKTKENNNDNDTIYYGLYDEKIVSIKNNEIYVDNKLYDTLEKECGSVYDIKYGDKTLVYYVNYSGNLSCLYDMKTKTVTHLLSNNVIPYDDGLFYNINDNNKIIKKNDIEEIIYNVDDVIEYNTNANGSKLVTIDYDKNINVYDSVNKKLLYELKLKDVSNVDFINDLSIGKYVTFLRYKDEKYLFYLWNYSKNENVNKKIVNKSDIDYKFENIKMIEDFKTQYDVNIYAYEDSVRFFGDFYALPSSDDEKINKTLKVTGEIVKYFNKDFFKKFEIGKKNGIKIYLNDGLGPSDLKTQISNPAGYSTFIDNDYVIALDINTSGYKVNLCHELMHSIENNMYDLFSSGKISFGVFDDWNSYNPNGFNYYYSYVGNQDDKYTAGVAKNAYFVDYYAKTYPNEDRARIFENLCESPDNNVLLNNTNLKRKAIYLKNQITKAYPSISDSELFSILK